MIARLLQSKWLVGVLVVVGLVTAGQPASAGVINWTDWTSATVGFPGSASGTILTHNGPVGVTYTGEVWLPTQTGAITDINYWNPAAPYLSATVDNAPPAADIITLIGGWSPAVVNTITFLTPVVDPVMALVSLGQPGGYFVYYQFDQEFTLLSFGPGYWNGGTLTNLGGGLLQGEEGHGAIQFHGSVSSISWVASPGENWHGFTVGAPVPEPGTMLLLGSGLAGLAARRRRRNNS